MLNVTDAGVSITLAQASKPEGDGMFWFASALLIGAVGVAMAMSLLSVRWSIAALALLIVGSYLFNRQRQKHKQLSSSHINSGRIDVFAGGFIHSSVKGQQNITLNGTDNVVVNDKTLTVLDSSGQQKYTVSGFDSVKEAQVMQAVLQGQKFGKRNANIKMSST